DTLTSVVCSHTMCASLALRLFFFTDTPPTEIYTLSLHDALPIYEEYAERPGFFGRSQRRGGAEGVTHFLRHSHAGEAGRGTAVRSEEHTSELQSRENLVCRLLLEKKKNTKQTSNQAVYE